VKSRKIIGTTIILGFTACFLWLKWKHDEPRRHSLDALQNLRAAIASNSAAILDVVVLPQAIAGQTSAEQIEFLDKALQDEISAEGIAALKRHGAFGPLKNLFPQEAGRWAEMAGVEVDNCVAFRMERGGIRAEVVLASAKNSYRVVRCDNVRQMATEN
jgi:hypothetical protein